VKASQAFMGFIEVKNNYQFAKVSQLKFNPVKPFFAVTLAFIHVN
jgi:hypothetical protein